MDRYSQTFETWNKLAALYQDKFMDLDLYDETYIYFCDTLTQANASILEIGCGPGNITKYLISKRPDFDVYGIDIAPNMVELAKKNNPTARFEVMDSRQIEALTTKFDGIVCGFCIPYLSETDCSKLIADAYHLLTDNGLLYLSFVEGNPAESGFQVGGSGDSVYFYFHDLSKIIHDLLDNRFGEPTIFKVNYATSDGSTDIHTILISNKLEMIP